MVQSTGQMLHLLNWNHEAQQVVYHRKAPLSRQAVDNLNLELSGILNRVNQIFFNYRVQQQQLDVETFKKLYASGGPAQSFHDYYQQYMELNAPLLAPGTVRQYRRNQQLLLQFMPQMHVHHLVPETIKRFDAFLRPKYNANTRQKHHRMAKHVMLLACKQHNLPNPYDGFKVRHIDGKREYLNKYEVQQLVKLLQSGTVAGGTLSALKKYLFSCHCGGLRISDIHAIGADDVFDGVLVLVPKKTSGSNKRVQVPLPDNWQQWVEFTTGARFFSEQTDQTINKLLKRIAKQAGITKKLTFHTARHTFATGFLNAGGKVEVLQRILGHSDIKTTMVYVHISRERLKEEAANVDLYK